jgi:DNA-binding beta-propeller fold protein YncE
LEGLTVDKLGHVFVADPDEGTVSQFAAGATGQQYPISTLNVGNVPDRLKIDDGERLFVHLNGYETIEIFARGAQGSDAPIRIIPTYGWSIDYVVARSGALYVLENNFAVTAYDNPFQSSSQPSRLIKPDGGFFEFNSTLVLDEATDRLYIQFGPDGQYWDKVDYDVRPPTLTSVPSVQKPWIFTSDCGSANYLNVGGAVIIKQYLIVSCLNNSDVLVYRTGRFGRQKAPIETVGQSSLTSPWEMAAGP